MNCRTNLVLLYILCAILLIKIAGSVFPEGFASERAESIYNTAMSMLGKSDTTFTDFKKKTPIDFVEYDSVKKLYNNGQLNPDAIDTFI